MEIIYTSPIMGYPAFGGPELRILNSIKALSKLTSIHIFSGANLKRLGGNNAKKHYESLSSSFHFLPSARGLRNIPFVRRFLQGSQKNLVLDANYLSTFIQKNEIKLIWFGYGNISYSLIVELRKRFPDIKMICDTDSVWSRFISRQIEFESNQDNKINLLSESKTKVLEERKWVELCDITTGVSSVDVEYYKTLTEAKEKIMQFSNVIDLSEYKIKTNAKLNLKKPYLFLAGTFGHENSSMNLAAKWLIKEIFPIVQRKIPSIHLYILGVNSDTSFKDLKNNSITILGKVDSVIPYLTNADVALTPLKYESGTRFKILEAAACRTPMVSTTLGAEGLPVTHGVNVLIADEPVAFANAIVQIVNDKALANKLASNSFSMVEQNFGLANLEKEAKEILKALNI